MPEITEIPRDSVIYPSGLDSFFDKEPPRLWYLGDPSLLNGKLLGVVSARKIDPDLALKASDLLPRLASLEVTYISGWHSPLEEEALRILLPLPVRIILCLSKSLNKFTPTVEVKALVEQGRALLLTHCSPKAKRISRDASIRRNRLVVALAKSLLVLSAPQGSASFKLAQLAGTLGRPVFATQHPINQRLLATGVLPATMENIQREFQ